MAFLAVIIAGYGNTLPASKTYSEPHTILPETSVNHIQNFTQVSRYKIGKMTDETDPGSAAKSYLLENAEAYGGASIIENLELVEVVKTASSTHVRFRQLWNGVPVYASGFNVSLDKQNEVNMVVASYVGDINIAMHQPLVSGEEAQGLVRNRLGRGMLEENDNPVELMVYRDREEQDRLVQVVHYPSSNPQGDWEVVVDAESSEFIKVRNTVFYLDAIGKVFMPDPLTTAEAVYGDPGYEDNSDADSDSLNAQRVTITLRDVTHNTTGYHLNGPYVEITDFDAPFIIPSVVQSDTGFCFTRNHNGFEEVCAYYHIDTMQRYIQSLGLDNLQNNPIEVDAHGVGGEDLSYYSPTLNAIAFGDGGVDDAEDADVIIHEYGHALHYAAVGDLISNDMRSVSEGISDYLAGSYSARFSTFHQDSVFNWDGFNPFFEGRVLTSEGLYPGDWEPWDYYNNGSIWANALWRIHNRIEPDSADAILLHSMYYHGPSSSVADAAEALLQAEMDLFDGRYRTAVYESLVEKGFLQPTIVAEPEEIVVSLERNTTLDTVIAITNHGGQLEWAGDILPMDESPIDPMTPFSSFPVGGVGSFSGVSGVTVMDDGYYMTAMDSEQNVSLLRYNADGELRASVQINDVTDSPFGELANDGEIIYGLANQQIHGFSPQGELLVTIPAAGALGQVITFEEDEDLFWVAGSDTTLLAYDRFGVVQDTIRMDIGPIQSITYYNLGNTYRSLLVLARDGDQHVIYVVDMDVKGVVGRYFLPENARWYGADCGVYSEALPNYVIYTSIVEQEDVPIHLETFLMDWHLPYVDVNSLTGVIPVNESVNIPVHVSAEGLEGGLYKADIFFFFEELDDTLKVPLKLTVVMVDAEDKNTIPEEFAVSNAYPNPFNSTVHVKMVLPEAQDVEMEIFNILGQRIFHKELHALGAGEHKLTWHTDSHLASGMYLLQIRTQNHDTHLQKVLLVR